MKIGNSIYRDGKDLYEHLERVINIEPETGNIGLVMLDNKRKVLVRRGTCDPKIIVLPIGYVPMLLDYLKKEGMLSTIKSDMGDQEGIDKLFGLEIFPTKLTKHIQIL